MAIGCPGSSVFGNRSQYIKVSGGDIVAVDSVNTRERLISSDLRIPYKQILKSRIILKSGQSNYLLNHLGMGDNATFLCIKATYDVKSVIEADNYISWSYYDNLTRINNFSQFMILTGNSTHKIPQLYLTNPNIKYPVYLDVMVSSIDDSYSIFNDILNQTGTTFTGLEYTDIHSYVVGESIVITDKSSPARPLIYITLSNINSIEINNNILIIDDMSLGTIFLQFISEYDTYQANSIFNYILNNPSVDISDISPLEDLISPIIYFNQTSGIGGDWISFNGTTGGSFSTSDGYTFSTSISLSTYGTSSGTIIDKPQLKYLLINKIQDNRDGYMYMNNSNMILSNISGSVSSITQSGTYSLSFDFSDMAHNYLDGVFMNINVIN